jgi:hypothetical protein
MNITMNNTFHLARALALAALCMPAAADEGHDHGPAPAAAAPALPRFAASSELFELVGIAKDRQLTIYLDRFADNAPVKGATLALEVGGARVALKEVADGEFTGALAQALKPGLTPVTATVTAGSDADLLAGEFDVHADTASAHVHSWKDYLGWALAAAALLALAFIARRAAAARRTGGAA